MNYAKTGWWQSLSLAILAGFLRIWNLGQPHAVVFDETYYVKDAWSLLNFGYEVDTVKDANELMLTGVTDLFNGDASYVVHPPFGKWVIAAGQWAFGLNPFGWRFMMALLGVIAVVMVYRITRRLFHHELTAWLAGLFMAIDGMAIVLSRTALLDQTLMFTVLAGFGAIVLDRDWLKRKLTAGERVLLRPWLIVGAIAFALAIATKWSGLWHLVIGGLLVIFFTARTRISLGHSQPWLKAIWQDTMPWLIPITVIVGGVYLATWTGWFLSDDAWNRNWAEQNPDSQNFLPLAIRSLLEYHISAWNFHTNLTVGHSYAANPWTWPLQLRPTSFYYETFQSGDPGCVTGPCSSEVIPLGNPLIWWAGTAALFQQLWMAISKRSAASTAIVLFFLAGWAPWLMYQYRTIFAFYSIVFTPFVVMALAAALGQLLGPAYAGVERKRRAFIVGGFTIAAITLSIFFLPLWTGDVVSTPYWQIHMWLTSWV